MADSSDALRQATVLAHDAFEPLSDFEHSFAQATEAMLLLDGERTIVEGNKAFLDRYGYTAKHLRGLTLVEVVRETGKGRARVIANPPAEDDDVFVLSHPMTVRGDPTEVVALYRDHNETRRIEDVLNYHSTHDALTGLLTRHEFERRLQDALSRPSSDALIYVNLDKFKLVNESGGHEAGDRLLVEVAELLRRQLRKGALLARMGSDEFAVLISDTSIGNAKNAAQRLVDAIRALPFRWGAKAYKVTASVGVIEVDAEMRNLGELLMAADAACEAARERGRDQVHLFRPDDTDLRKIRGSMAWANRLVEAVEKDQFQIYFQRILPVHNGHANGHPAHCEVLLRMVNEDGEHVAPGLFIAAAERYNLMSAVDRRVVERTLECMQRSQRRGETYDEVSINLSAASITDDSMAPYLLDRIKHFGIPPKSLCFEITETCAIANLEMAQKFIADMRSAGCRIALDDFGAGMASFAYLKALKIDYLKIDGRFIKDIDTGDQDVALVRAMTQVANTFGIRTIAECVEKEAALDRLRQIGVDYAQGFLLHLPQPWE